MLSKKVIKDIQSLGHKKFREETGLFLAEGPKIVNEFLELVPRKIRQIYSTEAGLRQLPGQAPVEVVSDAELQKMSQLKTAHEMLAVVEQFDGGVPEESDFVIYLDTIQDPGNMGTIIRIADWFGVKHIVCTEGSTDVYSPKVVQATMASLARVKFFVDKDCAWLNSRTGEIYAATLDGESLSDISKTNKGVLIIGNESKGIRPEFLEKATRKITIPRRGEAESLNAAVATGIILSHLLT
ncbi:MAG: TrmH family RNA methyltransferase [Flavisolibacter sp.]